MEDKRQIDVPLRVLCPECGDIIEVQDPEGLVRALHLMNSCTVGTLLRSQD